MKCPKCGKVMKKYSQEYVDMFECVKCQVWKSIIKKLIILER